MGLRGRLGNNLWQYAAGLALGRAMDAELLFDGHRVPEAAHLLPRLLGADYREATTAELRGVGVASFRDGTGPTVTRFALRQTHELARRLRGKSSGQVVRGDLTDRYRAELFELDPPVYVSGFFQDQAFLAGIEDDVAAGIRGPDHGTSLPEGVGTTVSVSFRRGDYNLYDAGLPLDYYDRAMRVVSDEVDAPTFVLFGDDPAFVEMFAERAQRRGHEVLSGLELGPGPLTQLRLLAACDHAILANSTFAWWGAWLGDRRGDRRSDCGRIVIAPTAWFRRAHPAQWRELDIVPGEASVNDLIEYAPSAAMSEPDR
jgi:hypothetical protein